MAKALKSALTLISKNVPINCVKISASSKQFGASSKVKCLLSTHGLSSPLSRTHTSLSSLTYRLKSNNQCISCLSSQKPNVFFYSSEVDKEISSFLEKEIQYEVSRSSNDLPKIRGFEVKTVGGDVTLTKSVNKETIVIRLSVNGAVDSVASHDETPNQNEPPEMVCRPPFEVEMKKENGSIFALQCSFPSVQEPFADGKQDDDKIEDQFEIQEVAFHEGEWQDETYTVSAATMDAELFDLLMDMLDERGINDEFISQLVDYCTAYENKQYITFLKSLKAYADK